MDTFAIVLIIILAVLIVAAFIIVAVSILSGKKQKPSEIHFSGGVNIDDGRIASDNNYFKGLSGALSDTISIESNCRNTSCSGLYITIKNMSDGQISNIKAEGQLTFGRNAGEGIFLVNDKSVSRRHCCMTAKNGKLLLSDLNSSNHTYLNGSQVYQEAEVHNGDTIKIGNVNLKIYFR